ncbi:MAG: tetratricopeptide repeat protein [Verrucomicrobia bacterium]|nr:tetratricopeptide repeat protein [Verrucomicrobiota bacterium]
MRIPHTLLIALTIAPLVLMNGGGCSKRNKMAQHLARAESFYAHGDFEKAKIEYFNVLRIERTNALSVGRVAVILHEQGALIQAVTALSRAKDLNPSDLVVRTHLARALFETTSILKARAEAISILETSPTNTEAIELLAFTSRAEKFRGDAQQRLDQLRQRTGDNAALHLASANLLFVGSDLVKAEAEIRKAIAMDPKYAAAHAALGNLMLTRTNGAAEAEQEMKVAYEIAAPRSPDRLNLVELLLRKGKADDAKKALDEILGKAPDFLTAKRLKARIALAEKRNEDALRLVEEILRIDAINFDAEILRAEAHLAMQQYGKAQEVLERLDRSFSPHPKVKYQLGVAYLLDKKVAQANTALEQAVGLDPMFIDAVMLKGQLDLRRGEPAKAAATLTPLARALPEHMGVMLLLTEIQLAEGRAEDAIKTCRSLAQSHPNSERPWFAMGIAFRQADKLKEARAAFEKARALAPKELAALYQLVDIELTEKSYARAMGLIEAQSPEARKGAGSLLLEGRIHLAQRAYDQAEAALQKAIAADANASAPYYMLARVYSESKQQDKAIAQLQALVAKNPREEQAGMLLGMLYSEKKEISKARQIYEGLLAINPLLVPALNNLAVLYADIPGQLGKGYEMAQKARNAQPEDPFIADTLGWILFRQKRYAEALPLIRQSSTKHRLDEVFYHLGMVHYMLGQENEAKAAFQTALSGKDPTPAAWKDDAQLHSKLLNTAAASSIAELQQLLKTSPDDVLVQYRIAELQETQGTFDAAARGYQAVIAANPQYVPALRGLARLNVGPLKDRAKAKELIDKARELAPQDVEVKAIAGKMSYEAGDFAQSYTLLKESSAILGNRQNVLHDFAWAAYALGREAESVGLMQRALALDAKSAHGVAAQWFLSMVAAYRDLKSLPPLETKIAQLLASDPDHVPGLMANAALQLSRGRAEDAAQSYERILRKFPAFALAQRQLGLLYADIPQQEARAMELALKARDTFQGDPDLLLALGKLSYRKKEFAGGLVFLQEASGRRPQDLDIAYYLGATYFQLKDPAKAKASLEKALAGGLKDPAAQDARKILSQLPPR